MYVIQRVHTRPDGTESAAKLADSAWIFGYPFAAAAASANVMERTDEVAVFGILPCVCSLTYDRTTGCDDNRNAFVARVRELG